jgi:hypothetical protein
MALNIATGPARVNSPQVRPAHLGLILPHESVPGPSRRSCPFACAGFRSKQTQANRAAPVSDGGRALSRGQATARPSPQAVSAHSGHDRSAKHIGNTRYARLQDANNQDWSPCLTCMLHRGSRINLYPAERQWLVPQSCILVAARLQDGWDSSLVRLIRPTRRPQSHIRPGIGPEAWAKLNQLVRQRRLPRSAPCRFRHIARERSPACARAR